VEEATVEPPTAVPAGDPGMVGNRDAIIGSPYLLLPAMMPLAGGGGGGMVLPTLTDGGGCCEPGTRLLATVLCDPTGATEPAAAALAVGAIANEPLGPTAAFVGMLFALLATLATLLVGYTELAPKGFIALPATVEPATVLSPKGFAPLGCAQDPATVPPGTKVAPCLAAVGGAGGMLPAAVGGGPGTIVGVPPVPDLICVG